MGDSDPELRVILDADEPISRDAQRRAMRALSDEFGGYRLTVTTHRPPTESVLSSSAVRKEWLGDEEARVAETSDEDPRTEDAADWLRDATEALASEHFTPAEELGPAESAELRARAEEEGGGTLVLSDGEELPAMGPALGADERFAAIEERLRRAEAMAEAARADTKDTTTPETVMARLRRLELALNLGPGRDGEAPDGMHAPERLDALEDRLSEYAELASNNARRIDGLDAGAAHRENADPEPIGGGPADVDEERGLYDKYEVYEDGEPVEGCFVLEPETDPAARHAIWAYARATPNHALARDLDAWWYRLTREVGDDG